MTLKATVNMNLVTPQLTRIAGMLNGDASAMKPVLESMGQIVAGWHVRNFQDRGKRFGGWEPIGVFAALLRARGKGSGKIRSWDDAKRLAREAIPLSDTGRLRTSLQAGGANSVFRVGRIDVTVGTNVKYANKHQIGSGDFFRFGAAEERRLRANVSDTLPGRPGKGRAKNWNPEFFQMLGAMRKRNGRGFRVRRRQIVIDKFTAREMQILDQDVTRVLDRVSSERSRKP